jgi:hypothetical protein
LSDWRKVAAGIYERDGEVYAMAQRIALEKATVGGSLIWETDEWGHKRPRAVGADEDAVVLEAQRRIKRRGNAA